MKKALVVGINQYPSAPLLGCIQDAAEVARLLETHEDQTANFSIMLRTDIARKNVLKELIADLFAGRNETALFYFSGHGFINELGGYLVTPDHRRYDEGISMNDILVLANKSGAANKIIILDCCHSGALAAPDLTPGFIGHISEGVTILTASRQDEKAIEVNGKGVFTNLLLEALRGGAADISGHITPGGIYAYIDQALGPWEQRPVFKTNVCNFTTLRKTVPRIEVGMLKKIGDYFPVPDALYPLDPSYEYTNDPEIKPVCMAPFASPQRVDIFKTLQKMQSVGLVEPVGEAHMYWAAMNGKSCRLTPLGAHYWRLAKERKI